MVNKSSSTQQSTAREQKKNQFPNNNASNAIKCNQHPFAYLLLIWFVAPMANRHLISMLFIVSYQSIMEIYSRLVNPEVGHPPYRISLYSYTHNCVVSQSRTMNTGYWPIRICRRWLCQDGPDYRVQFRRMPKNSWARGSIWDQTGNMYSCMYSTSVHNVTRLTFGRPFYKYFVYYMIVCARALPCRWLTFAQRFAICTFCKLFVSRCFALFCTLFFGFVI